MIEKISGTGKQYTPKKDIHKNQSQQPAFKGVGDLLIKGIQACEKEPMVNVSVLDLSTGTTSLISPICRARK